MGIAERVAAKHLGLPVPEEGRAKTAAFPPPDQAPSTRNIPKNHEFDKKALKPLSRALWACSVAQGHALTAYRQMSRLKSTTVSPDGMLGGRGYTQNLADMRKKLHEAAEVLSSICDTLYDEATAPHWQPKLAQLDEDDQGDISRFISEAQEAMNDPEGEAEEDMAEIEAADNPPPKIKPDGLEEGSSSLPQAGGHQDEPSSNRPTAKTASKTSPLWTAEPIELTASSIFVANSSVSPDTLGGPRIDHRGPGEGEGPYGSYNEDEPLVEDQWSADGGGPGRRAPYGEDYDYPSPWENTAAWKESSSGTPTDDTPSEGRDWGLGFGANGQGTHHLHPSGEGDGNKGVLGPHSGLPGTPDLSSGDPGDGVVDYQLNLKKAYEALYGEGVLPQDVAGPVSRSDYFEGPKDNMTSVGTSTLPVAPQNMGPDGEPLVDTYYTETDMDTEYVRWDSTTHTLREPRGEHPGQDYQEPWAPDGEATR